MRITTAVACGLALAGPVHAQDPFERLKDLPFEEALTEVGVQTNENVPLGLFRFQARRALADLYYPVDLRTPFAPLTDADTVAAIRAFEDKLGATPDGVLSWDEYVRLDRFGFLSRVTSLSVGVGLNVSAYDTVYPAVFASGSWSMPDIAWPLNQVEIKCWIHENTCTETTTNVWAPALAGSQGNATTYQLSAGSTTYDIASYENGILDAVTTSSCRQIRLSINTSTKLVTQTAQDLTTDGCGIPGSQTRLDPIRELRVATLIDSFEAQSAYEEKRRSALAVVRGPLGVQWDAEVAAFQ